MCVWDSYHVCTSDGCSRYKSRAFFKMEAANIDAIESEGMTDAGICDGEWSWDSRQDDGLD